MISYILTHARSVSGDIVLDKGIVVTESATKTVDILTDGMLEAKAAGLITITMPTAPENITMQGSEISEESAFSGAASAVPEIVSTGALGDCEDNDATLMKQINYNREDILKLAAIIETIINNLHLSVS